MLAGAEHLGVAGLDDLEGADLVEAGGERPGEAGGHVLGHEDRQRQALGQRAQQLLDRGRSAGRGGDAEDAAQRGAHDRGDLEASAVEGGDLAGGPLEALLDQGLGAGQQADHAEAADHADLGEQVVLDGAQVGADVAAGLGDEVHGAELERAEHVVAFAVARDDDDRQRALAHQQAEEREAVHLRHLEVEGDDVGHEVEGLAQGLLAVARAADDLDERVGLEHGGDRLAVVGRVVDDQHLELLVRCAWRELGRFRGHEREAVNEVDDQRGDDQRGRRSRGPTVDEVAVEVDEVEAGGDVEEALGVAEEEVAAGGEGVEEALDDAVAGLS
jgi:hypothetical protein